MVTFPITLPSYERFESFIMTETNIIGESISPYTGESEVQEFQGKLWGGEFTWSFENREVANPFISALSSLRGKVGTFLLGDPDSPAPLGVATGTPLVNGANQSGLILATKGWTPSTAGILLANDYIQLGTGSSSRLYKVVEDVASDVSGNATLEIWPNLRQLTANDEPLTLLNTQGQFRLAENNRVTNYSYPTNRSTTVKFKEAI